MSLQRLWPLLAMGLLLGCSTSSGQTPSELDSGADIARQAGAAVGETTVIYATSTKSAPDEATDVEAKPDAPRPASSTSDPDDAPSRSTEETPASDPDINDDSDPDTDVGSDDEETSEEE